MGQNSFNCVGVVSNEPKYVVSNKGTPTFVANIVINDTAKNKEEYSPFFRFVVFGDKATKANELVKKGDTVAITGYIVQRTRKNKYDFVYYETNIVAEQIFRVHRPVPKQEKAVEENERRITMIGGSGD